MSDKVQVFAHLTSKLIETLVDLTVLRVKIVPLPAFLWRLDMIQKWWLKCAAQQVLSHLPQGRRINSLWSRRAVLEFDDYALQQALTHVQMLRRRGFDLTGKVALEFGTGWTPILPYVLRLAGCSTVICCDLYRHITAPLVLSTIQHLRDRASRIAQALDINVATVHNLLPKPAGQDLPTLLRQSGFDYRAPYDVRHTDYPDHAIDLVTSRAVLEHIPRAELQRIMKEMRRILRPTGVMVHTIDNSDHWQHFDPGISRINYLKFSQASWRVLNSAIAYQNRLRSCEHVELIRQAGFAVTDLEAPVDAVALSDAHESWIHADYRAFRDEDLAVLMTSLVAQPLRPSVQWRGMGP